MGGEPPWFPIFFLSCRLHWKSREFWLCFHGVEPIDFVPPYLGRELDLLIDDYHVIGKCSISSCQRKQWTVMYCVFDNLLSYLVYHLMKYYCMHA